jgi:hypothetical protein
MMLQQEVVQEDGDSNSLGDKPQSSLESLLSN